jgi:diaminohydroxyphosphoribosylaminopyrimidine deaminase / 5-amino-6-(5-phosphoribosylamino)uracil reductase
MRPRPKVTLKLATSLDGRIATATGESQWITGPAARARVHELRAAHDAVLVGAGTALADNPLLTARTEPASVRQPWRVVLSRTQALPLHLQLFQSVGLGPVAVVGMGNADALGALGVLLIPAPSNARTSDMLEALAQETGITSVMIEGGGVLAAALANEDRIDALEWFRAPILLGASGKPAIAGLGHDALSAAPRFQRTSVAELGSDLHETYVRAT